MHFINSFAQYSQTTSYNDSTVGLSGLLLFMAIYAALVLFYTIPMIACTWSLFKKANHPGWAAIIPFYSSYVFGAISKKPMWMVWFFVLSGLVSWIPFIGFLIGIATLVIALILLSGFVKQYDRGIGFWLFYIFLPLVAVFMVGKANYTGDGQVGVNATRSPMPVGPASSQSPTPVEADPVVLPQPIVAAQVPVGAQQPQPLPEQQTPDVATQAPVATQEQSEQQP